MSLYILWKLGILFDATHEGGSIIAVEPGGLLGLLYVYVVLGYTVY